MRRSAAALALALLLPLPGLAGEVVVKPGETLSEIAERYGTTVQRLMQLNGLQTPKDLWAGSRIQVPGASSNSAGVQGPSSGAGNYTVKSGETLSEIAERYGTTVQRLMQLNNLQTPQDLWAGSRIQVPGASAPSRTTSTRPPVNRNAREHRVQPGETLSEIAALYGIPMNRLVALNGLSQPNNVQAGTTLKLRGTVPSSNSSASRPTTPATRSGATAPTTASRPPASAPRPATPRAANTTAVATTTTTSTTATTTTAGTAQAASTTATTSATPTSTPRPTVTATRPSTTPASTTSKPATPDWRSYGPLQVDWANWQPMAGSFVAPSLNSDGQPLYLAVNCSARRLNATGQSGIWKTWDAPRSDFEEQLVSDLCKTKGS
jgi:LysM repeat protein